MQDSALSIKPCTHCEKRVCVFGHDHGPGAMHRTALFFIHILFFHFLRMKRGSVEPPVCMHIRFFSLSLSHSRYLSFVGPGHVYVARAFIAIIIVIMNFVIKQDANESGYKKETKKRESV